MKSLADKLEAAAKRNAEAKVSAAMRAAFADAQRAFQQQLAPLIGNTLHPAMLDALNDAATAIGQRALDIVERAEIDAITRRLTGEVLELEG